MDRYAVDEWRAGLKVSRDGWIEEACQLQADWQADRHADGKASPFAWAHACMQADMLRPHCSRILDGMLAFKIIIAREFRVVANPAPKVALDIESIHLNLYCRRHSSRLYTVTAVYLQSPFPTQHASFFPQAPPQRQIFAGKHTWQLSRVQQI